MSRRAWWTVIALCTAQFVLILDVVVVTVAIPSIRHDLDLLDSRIALTGTAYTVTFGSLLIVSGRAGDRLGRRRLLLTGLVVFVAASLLAGLSRTDWQLFTARGLQGVGAAMISANALAAITAGLDEGPARTRALGLWAAVGSAGAIAGQLVGGAVTELLGWRWIFFINVPIGVAVVAVLAVLVRDRGTGARTGPGLTGSALLTGGLVGLLLALTWLGEDGHPARWITAAAAGAALLTAFALLDRRRPAPLLRLALLRLPGVRTANATLLLNAGALGAVMFFVTLYLQVVLGHSALAVGLAFAPITVLILLLSPRAAALTTRYGIRPLLTGGLVLLGAGALLLARIPVGGSYWVDVLPGMLLLAGGSALAYAPTFVAASTGVAPEDHGAASGLISSAQEIGTAVGLAALALVAHRAAGPGTAPADLVTGYRTGLVGAAVLFAVAATIAAVWSPTAARPALDAPGTPARTQR